LNAQEKSEKTDLHLSDEAIIRCPNCGEKLSDEVFSQLLKTEEKEFGYLVLGVVFGAILGLVGNLWVAFMFEVFRSLIPEGQWLLSSIIGLVLTTFVTIYALVKMLRFTMKHMGIKERRDIRNEGVEP